MLANFVLFMLHLGVYFLFVNDHVSRVVFTFVSFFLFVFALHLYIICTSLYI